MATNWGAKKKKSLYIQNKGVGRSTPMYAVVKKKGETTEEHIHG